MVKGICNVVVICISFSQGLDACTKRHGAARADSAAKVDVELSLVVQELHRDRIVKIEPCRLCHDAQRDCRVKGYAVVKLQHR